MTTYHRKRKRAELETDDYSAGIETEMSKFSQSSNKKNTIDSDDDDEEDYNKKKYDVMNQDEIEGQEEGTVDFDGETKITPFNMNNEMEEGYFDGNGMYIWNKKDANELTDSLLDSIDWLEVKKVPDAKNTAKETSFQSQIEEKLDVLTLYQSLIHYLRPGESILQSIKRLGGNKRLSASERLKQKKLAKAGKITQGKESSGQAPSSSSSKATQEETDVGKLTEIVNKILTLSGNMDIYQETFESVTFKISKKSSIQKSEDDDLDMFSDDFTKKEKETKSDTQKSSENETSESDEGSWEDDERKLIGENSKLRIKLASSEETIRQLEYINKLLRREKALLEADERLKSVETYSLSSSSEADDKEISSPSPPDVEPVISDINVSPDMEQPMGKSQTLGGMWDMEMFNAMNPSGFVNLPTPNFPNQIHPVLNAASESLLNALIGKEKWHLAMYLNGTARCAELEDPNTLPPVTGLARAYYNFVISDEQNIESGISELFLPLSYPAQKLLTVIQVLSRADAYSDLPLLAIQFFNTQIISNRYNSLQAVQENINVVRLGRFYGALSRQFDLVEEIKGVIFNALYWRPVSAFSLTYGILCLHSDIFSGLPYENFGLTERSMIYALACTPHLNDAKHFKHVQSLLKQSLNLMIPELTYEQFVDTLLEEMKGLEEDNKLKKAGKAVSMLCMQMNRKCFEQFIITRITRWVADWKERKITDAVLAVFINVIGTVECDTPKHGPIIGLKTIVSKLKSINIDQMGQLLKEAIFSSYSKLEEKIRVKES